MRVRDLFHKYDADGSGDIDLPEFEALLKELGLSPGDARLIVPLFDIDNDGQISYKEFTRILREDPRQYMKKIVRRIHVFKALEAIGDTQVAAKDQFEYEREGKWAQQLTIRPTLSDSPCTGPNHHRSYSLSPGGKKNILHRR